MTNTVRHLTTDIDGIEIFYREAGRQEAPVVLLPHGYPCSSYEFRDFMPRMADRWRLVAPDFPGCGYSDTPKEFRYDFDGYSNFLARFTERLGIGRFAIWLHDFGSQIGLRLAIAHPDRIAAVIIQNGDIYEDVLGPQYATLKQYWDSPTPERRAEIRASITKDEFKREFLNDVRPDLRDRMPPDLWELHWSLMTERRKDIAADVITTLRENLAWFPRYQGYLCVSISRPR